MRHARQRAAMASLLLALCAHAQDAALEVRLTIDLGKDIGQNFGTLFEARDANGKAVAGAAFRTLCSVHGTRKRARGKSMKRQRISVST